MNNGNVFRYPVDVRFFEVDSLGVVFNMWYLGWCDEAMSAFMESIGYGYAMLRAKGFDAVLRNAQIEWIDSMEAFQHVEIAVGVDHVGTTSFRLSYGIDRVDPVAQAGRAVQTSRTGELGQTDQQRTPCVQVKITYVCVELDGRGKTPLPLGLREALVQDHSCAATP